MRLRAVSIRPRQPCPVAIEDSLKKLDEGGGPNVRGVVARRAIDDLVLQVASHIATRQPGDVNRTEAWWCKPNPMQAITCAEFIVEVISHLINIATQRAVNLHNRPAP